MPQAEKNINAPSKHPKNVYASFFKFESEITPFQQHVFISNFIFLKRLRHNINCISL